jgi:hypothetical protein
MLNLTHGQWLQTSLLMDVLELYQKKLLLYNYRYRFRPHVCVCWKVLCHSDSITQWMWWSLSYPQCKRCLAEHLVNPNKRCVTKTDQIPTSEHMKHLSISALTCLHVKPCGILITSQACATGSPMKLTLLGPTLIQQVPNCWANVFALDHLSYQFWYIFCKTSALTVLKVPVTHSEGQISHTDLHLPFHFHFALLI